MLCPFLIKNYYPFDKNLEIKYFNDFLNKIIKIQRWLRYYNVKHILFHKNNNTQFIMTYSYGRALQQSALKVWSKNI